MPELTRVLISNGGGFATSNGATLTVTFTDTDGDGMQNAWETLYGLNPNSGADATLDKDGDGETNKEEFLAGTDPNNPNSTPATDNLEGDEWLEGHILGAEPEELCRSIQERAFRSDLDQPANDH
jgi:hypothetical protein